MAIVYIVIVCAILGVAFFLSRRKQAVKPPVFQTRIRPERMIGGNVKIQVNEKLVDVDQVRQKNARQIIDKIGRPATIEEKLILDDPTGFIYFARFFDARVRYGETKPVYVDIEDHYRRRYDQATAYGLALRGNEIGTIEILQSLRLKKELNQLSDKKFSRIKDAIEYLVQLPDIDRRVDQLRPRQNWFKIKNISLDMEFLNSQWEIIDSS
jgi:hypothetical protein